ncbi:MAG: hypothetical protein IH796_00435 [Deltaproteobacteria bacterium]|nr:hypothetical protein [Deltaproteobacteria bacterium]
MSLGTEISRILADQFVALILDNEVTVGHFVLSPPLPWTRVTELKGQYQVPQGPPVLLTAEQTKIEMKTWDEVSLQGIVSALKELGDSVDYVLIGNNAGQGLPLAQGLPQNLIVDHAGIIFGERLPERKAYEQMEYRSFYPRAKAIANLLELAQGRGRPLSLVFINTIQHNEFNYHDP